MSLNDKNCAKLELLGWDEFFQNSFDKLGDPALIPARVIRQEKIHYLIMSELGEMTANLPGRLRADGKCPVVGDWLAVSARHEEKASTIKALLPRKSKFSRKVTGTLAKEQVLVANIDFVFIVTAADGDFNPRRLERYVTLTENSGATPVIILNKIDLEADIDGMVRQINKAVPRINVHPISSANDIGYETLSEYFKNGQTSAFLGSSGVGKSTMVNRLLGFDYMKTRTVRPYKSRGRHTTTHRELIQLPGGGVVIDSPGMRELQLWGDQNNLRGAFGDIEQLATECRFRNCQHTTEPDCEVRKAIGEGRLEADHFHNYLSLQKELALLARKQNALGRHEVKKQGKNLSKSIKQHTRNNPKRK